MPKAAESATRMPLNEPGPTPTKIWCGLRPAGQWSWIEAKNAAEALPSVAPWATTDAPSTKAQLLRGLLHSKAKVNDMGKTLPFRGYCAKWRISSNAEAGTRLRLAYGEAWIALHLEDLWWSGLFLADLDFSFVRAVEGQE